MINLGMIANIKNSSFTPISQEIDILEALCQKWEKIQYLFPLIIILQTNDRNLKQSLPLSTYLLSSKTISKFLIQNHNNSSSRKSSLPENCKDTDASTSCTAGIQDKTLQLLGLRLLSDS